MINLKHLHRRWLIPPILVVAVFVAGCGGSGSESTAASRNSGSTSQSPSTGQPLTKAEFVAQADALCEATDKRQEARYKVYVQEHGEGNSRAYQQKLVTNVGLPAIRRELEEIRALGLPKGDQKIKVIMNSAEEAFLVAEEDPGIVLQKSGSPFDESEKLAKEYGFKACGFV
jgi:hypothetical protein